MARVAIEARLQPIDAREISETGIGTEPRLADARPSLRHVAVRVGELNADHGQHDECYDHRHPSALESPLPLLHRLEGKHET